MIPHKQRFRHDPANGIWGDCHRTVIASALHLELDDVPHFGDGGPSGPEFDQRVKWFLASRGLVPVHLVFTDDLPNVLMATTMNPESYCILGGRSKTGVDHSVLVRNGEIVNDPSLNDSGILGPCDDGYYWLTYFGALLK